MITQVVGYKNIFFIIYSHPVKYSRRKCVKNILWIFIYKKINRRLSFFSTGMSIINNKNKKQKSRNILFCILLKYLFFLFSVFDFIYTTIAIVVVTIIYCCRSTVINVAEWNILYCISTITFLCINLRGERENENYFISRDLMPTNVCLKKIFFLFHLH